MATLLLERFVKHDSSTQSDSENCKFLYQLMGQKKESESLFFHTALSRLKHLLLRNPWLPGWIFTTTLILSVLVLIWICCATVATAVDQYVPAEVSCCEAFGDCSPLTSMRSTIFHTLQRNGTRYTGQWCLDLRV